MAFFLILGEILRINFLDLMWAAISKLKEEAKKITERSKEDKFDENTGAKLVNEKRSWMSSAQLWSPVISLSSSSVSTCSNCCL